MATASWASYDIEKLDELGGRGKGGRTTELLEKKKASNKEQVQAKGRRGRETGDRGSVSQ